MHSCGALRMRASLWAVKGNKSWRTQHHNTLKETWFRIKCLICGIIPPTSVQMLCDTSDFCFDTLSQHSPHNIVYHSFFRETSYNIYPDGSSLPTYSRHCHETKCWKLLTSAAELQECSHLAFYFSTLKVFSQNLQKSQIGLADFKGLWAAGRRCCVGSIWPLSWQVREAPRKE